MSDIGNNCKGRSSLNYKMTLSIELDLLFRNGSLVNLHRQHTYLSNIRSFLQLIVIIRGQAQQARCRLKPPA